MKTLLFQLREEAEPDLITFTVTCFKTQNLAITILVNTYCYKQTLRLNPAGISCLYVDGVNNKKGVSLR